MKPQKEKVIKKCAEAKIHFIRDNNKLIIEARGRERYELFKFSDLLFSLLGYKKNYR